MTRIRITIVLLVLSVCSLAWSTKWNSQPMPIAGLHGSGVGYCVTVEDESGKVLGNVEVPYHVINPQERQKRGMGPLPAGELEASIKNAVALVAPGADSSSWVCATTYRDKQGNVIGCSGGCGDCVKVRVKQRQ